MTHWPAGWKPYAEVHKGDNTITGTVLVWPKVAGDPGIPGREICVYLPPSLARSLAAGEGGGHGGRRYPVLYFMDGQNVFDAKTSYIGVEWAADEALEKLAEDGIEAIAVAVANHGDDRMNEYNPWRSSLKWRGRAHPTGGKGDAYLEWLVGTVKPLIDRSLPTRAERMATGIVGSSMGGLISLYALFAQRAVFGLAGVMSPAVAFSDYRVVALIEEAPLPPTRIHLDMGWREWRGATRDARKVRDALLSRGFELDRDLHYVEERNARHNEAAWARRLPDALRFLLADFREPR
ncbi:MAG TPA: alpha/beta hydrolase-fold protein [Candidatus Limnocylindrales bacterium]